MPKIHNDRVQLPADDAYQPDQLVQWWYWTGHLRSASGRRFGFEVTFFAVSAEAGHLFESFIDRLEHSDKAVELFAVQPVHFAITDIDKQSFHSRVDYRPGPPRQIQNGFELSNLGNSVQANGGNGRDSLHGEVDGFVLDLHLQSRRSPVIHYEGERHQYAFGGYTYYYSREDLEVSGTLVADGENLQVDGQAWFDRQYGELVQATFVGWQWFSLQLEGDIKIMLFDFHRYDSELYGSITDGQGSTRSLGPGDFSVEILDWWVSPHTSRRYPSKWRIQVDGKTLTITPLVADQEINELWEFPKYWEGACDVTGDLAGQAYVELNGYPRTRL